jgi:hypothetical protein
MLQDTSGDFDAAVGLKAHGTAALRVLCLIVYA